MTCRIVMCNDSAIHLMPAIYGTYASYVGHVCVPRVFFLLCTLYMFLYVFHNVLCVICDTSVVIDFRGFVLPSFVVTEATKQRSSLPQLTVDTCTKSQRHSKLNVLTVK